MCELDPPTQDPTQARTKAEQDGGKRLRRPVEIECPAVGGAEEEGAEGVEDEECKRCEGAVDVEEPVSN